MVKYIELWQKCKKTIVKKFKVDIISEERIKMMKESDKK